MLRQGHTVYTLPWYKLWSPSHKELPTLIQTLVSRKQYEVQLDALSHDVGMKNQNIR